MPDDVDARMLDPEARRELRGLTRETADLVARHLVVTGRTLDDDPTEALAHARAARAMAGRIGVVREAVGLAAYAAGEWAEALSELRAARRITGRPEHLAVLADCERALGRPDRALAYADDPAVATLPQDERVELVIVLSGARRDLGQADAAVLALQDPARRTTAARPWAARLWYAYADALLGAGREAEARDWFGRVAEIDAEGATDAGDRLLELDGVRLEDLDEDGSEDGADGGGIGEKELAALVAEAFPAPTAGSTDALQGSTSSEAPRDALEVSTDAPERMDALARSTDAAEAPVRAPEDGTPPGNADTESAQGDKAGTATDEAAEPVDRLPATGRGPAFTAVEPPPAAPAPAASALMPTFASPPDATGDADDDRDDSDPDDLTLFD